MIQIGSEPDYCLANKTIKHQQYQNNPKLMCFLTVWKSIAKIN